MVGSSCGPTSLWGVAVCADPRCIVFMLQRVSRTNHTLSLSSTTRVSLLSTPDSAEMGFFFDENG